MHANMNTEQAAELAALLPEHPGPLTIENGSEHGTRAASRVFTFGDGYRVAVDVFGRVDVLTPPDTETTR